MSREQREISTRALTFTYPGSHPHWTYTTIQLPVARNQVVIQVSACTLSTVDIGILNTQLLWAKPGEKGFGREFVGSITHVGADTAAKWKVGDEVCGLFYHPFGAGALSSHIVVDPVKDFLIKKPETLSVAEAASFPLSFGLAYQCLANVKLTPDSTVCVLGGGTNVGMYAIQIAKQVYNVRRVVATCSAESATMVKYMGADEVVDYKATTDLVRALTDLMVPTPNHKFDIVVDTVGTDETINGHMADLTPAKTGVFVSTVGDRSNPSEPLEFLTLTGSLKKSLLGAIKGPRYKIETVSPGQWIYVAQELFEAAKLKVLVDSVTGWDDYKTAFEKLTAEEAEPKGKIVIKVEQF
ncbi:GroES-like protein [Dipodascopsis tothii]|uniref:GroES-like protein n=1 Tax=Dipodascopsis tothii TaxID=44089 RepID=UPI0034CEAE75